MATAISRTSRPSLLGNGLLVIWGDVDTKTTDEDALNDWWTNEHLPERLSISGFLRARRYYSADDDPSSSISKAMVCYEVSSLETLTSKDYLAKLNDPTPGTAKYMPLLATLERRACSVVHSEVRDEFAALKTGPVGATIARYTLAVPSLSPAPMQELRDWVSTTLSHSILSSHHSVLAVHVVETDATATKSGNASKSYEAVRLPEKSTVADQTGTRWILLVEFSSIMARVLERSSVPMLKPEVGQYLGSLGVKVVSHQLYELICVASE